MGRLNQLSPPNIKDNLFKDFFLQNIQKYIYNLQLRVHLIGLLVGYKMLRYYHRS
jgi:hypothetical protein